MSELTEKHKNHLKSVIKKITKISIGDECPKGFCFSTSLMLSIYLETKGISSRIVAGEMNDCPHFWLNLLDYDDIILDATIKQFDKNQKDCVYIGSASENDITKQYIVKTYSFNEWINSYQVWCNPEFCSDGITRREEELFRKIVKNNLIGASLLLDEIEKTDLITQSNVKNSYLYELYFQSIYSGLKHRWKRDETLMKTVSDKIEIEFKFLLSKTE